jgi:transglutaminase-like putative cysteine protease
MDAKEFHRLSAKALANIDTALGEADADRPIRYLIEVEQDQQMRRAFPATARQKVEQVAPGRWRVSVTPGPSLADPVAASPLSTADRRRYTDGGGIAARIRSAADEIVADKTPPKEAVQLILAWMKRNMTYELTPRELRDEAILERRRGDCSEYSKLTIALLRAKGIPARMRSGFLADGGDLVAHAWVEFFDGSGWREIDPTAGASSVDARHVDASLVDVMSLLLLAQIKVAGIE